MPHVGKVSPIFMEEEPECKYDQTVHFVEQITHLNCWRLHSLSDCLTDLV